MRVWLVALCLLASCNRNGAGEGAKPEPAVTVTAPPPSAQPPQAGTAGAGSSTREASPPPPAVGPRGPGPGAYASGPCPGRTYERVVNLGQDGAVEIADRVAPCPPNAKCVWSGIVVRSGTYRVEGPSALGRPFRVVLDIQAASNPKANALPSHLLWWESRGALTEPDESCRYRRRP